MNALKHPYVPGFYLIAALLWAAPSQAATVSVCGLSICVTCQFVLLPL